MAKSKVGLKYDKIVRSSSGASAHSNAGEVIVKHCKQNKNRLQYLFGKSGTPRESQSIPPDMLKLRPYIFAILVTFMHTRPSFL